MDDVKRKLQLLHFLDFAVSTKSLVTLPYPLIIFSPFKYKFMKTIFSTFILLLLMTSAFGQTEAEEISVDTIIVFDPTTGEETTHIVKNKVKKGVKTRKLPADSDKNKFTIEAPIPGQRDTIITFDPKTFEESMMVIEWKSIPALQPDGTKKMILKPDTLRTH